MADSSENPFGRRADWTLTRDSLRRLLHWLDGGVSSDGQAYVEMRRRLRDYFVRKNCPTAEELADETMTRVARRLEEENITTDDTPARYCYIVARFVFLEHRREAKAHPVAVDIRGGAEPRSAGASAANAGEAADARERLLACLDKCIQELDMPNQRIITSYYIGREGVKIERRRELAESLGVTMNALAVRAYRIRVRLEGCVRRCVAS